MSGLVINELGRNPASGEVFVFVNRRRNCIKLLHWERVDATREALSCTTSD
ncbi:IS66 family insertion sequence element accessory protein TnpB [Catalinimonas locisalis]|uniref:IS66 family insertion sequence element accessory protein TnpB n=1 Tax=Catalinimonas locisalis TaxID=3133978 RepID=UPI00403F7455